MKFSPLVHVILALAVFVLAAGAYGAWYSYVGKESARAAALAGEIQTKTLERARIERAKDELDSVTKDEMSVDGYFLDTKDVVPFLESLQSTGQALGANVEVVSVSAEPSKTQGHLNLSVRVTGSFDSVLRTIGAIEYQPYDTSLNSLTFDTPGNSATTAQWTAAATFSVGTTERAAPTQSVSTTTP